MQANQFTNKFNFKSGKEKQKIRSLSRDNSVPIRIALRARMLLLRDKGKSQTQIAEILDVNRDTVSQWEHRYKDGGIKGLYDKPGRGRKPSFSPKDGVTILSIACQSPEEYGMFGQTIWTIDSLQKILLEFGYFDQISWTTIQRFLSKLDLKPHRMDYYLFCEDSELVSKAKKICDLYINPPDDAVLLSYDERTGMQALERKKNTFNEAG